MKRRIRRNRQVEADLISIYTYIHEKSPAAAEKVLDGIEQYVRSLLDTPGIGTLWNSPDPRLKGLRVAVVKPYRAYLAFFRATPEGIELFRIIHGARELGPLIEELEIDFED